MRCLRIALVALVFLAASFVVSSVSPTKTNALSGSDYPFGRIIDDSLFTDKNSMSVAQVQQFLESKVQGGSCDRYRATYNSNYNPPWTCLFEFEQNPSTGQNNYGQFDGNGNPVHIAGGKSAAEIIWQAGQDHNISPKVLIVLLQKEQGLVTDNWPWTSQYSKATGYLCPDTAPCNPSQADFYKQVDGAAKLFRYYLDNLDSYWYGIGNNDILYNPNQACGRKTINIVNASTVALHLYTPYTPNQAALNNLYGTGDSCSAYGNRNFWRYYNDWFGSTHGLPDYSCKNGTNVTGAGTGVRVMPNRPVWGADRLSLVQLNITSSACIEIHTWADGDFQRWAQHVGTNRHSISPADARMLTADTDGDGRDEMIVVEYQNTASGRIEIHTLTSDYQHWASHIATNRPTVNSLDSEVIAADTNGDGRDELYLVDYRNTSSGKIELHGWSSNYQQWISHTATNRPAIDPANAAVISADVNGDVKDEFLLVEYQNTSSGYIEVHGWAPGQQSWFVHTATNRPAINPGTRANPLAEVISADVNGNLAQELHLVQYGLTGSGRVEIHTWAGNNMQWIKHSATSQGSYQ